MKRYLPAVLVALILEGCQVQPGAPLIGAAREGRVDAIRTLLAKGADPNLRAGVNDWTPLLHAIHRGQKGSVLALLDGGADVNAKTKGGLTALIMAAGYGYWETVQALLDHGADPYAETSAGVNALTAAVGGVADIDKFTLGQCQTATVAALLKKAPNLKLPDNFSGRAARFAARAGNCSEVLRLIDHN